MEQRLEYIAASAELSLLLRLMQGCASADGRENPQRFDALVRKNRLEMLVCERLAGGGMSGYDEDGQTMRAMRMISLLGGLARLFERAGIRMLSVKGPALAMEIYGTPALRAYHDLDLLVPEAQVDAAVDLLLADGWTWHEAPWLTTPRRRRESRRSQQHYLFMRGEFCVELHWRLLPWDSGAFEQLWAQRRCVTLGGSEICVPGTMHQLYHLVSHGARHGFHRMKWLADLCVLLPRHAKEMDALYAAMEQDAQGVMLLETWLLLLRLKELDIPEISFGGFEMKRTAEGVRVCGGQAALARAAELVDALFPLLEAQEDIEQSPEMAAYRALLPRPVYLRALVSRLADRLRPNRYDWEWIDLPDALYGLYWPLRLLRKLCKEIGKRFRK